MEICNSCQGGCCRNFTVSLTGYDILNISKTLRVHPASFINIIEVEAGADIEYKSKHTALFRFSDYDKDKYYIFGIRMVESKLALGTAKCQFLVEWNLDEHNPSVDGIIARCGIYNCRPLLCAAFPTKFDETEKQGIMVNTSLFGQNFEHPIYKTCSRTLSQEDISNPDEIMKILVLRKYELDYFKNLAIKWDENPGTLMEFFDFMTKAYQNRVTIE